MAYDKYSFKYSTLYPLITFCLNTLLVIMGIYALNHYFDLLKLNFVSVIAISIFLFEAVIRFNAGQKLALPKFLFILEAVFFLLVISLFTSGFYNIRLWIIWGLGLISWFNIYSLTNSFRLFGDNCDKVYGKGENLDGKKRKRKKWTFDEFRRLLDYPSYWKRIVEAIYFSNIPLVLIWVLIHEVETFLVTGSIIYLALEVFLLGSLYLDKKTMDWYIEGLERPPILKMVWLISLVLTLIVIVSIAVLLPYNYSPLPLESICSWFSSLPLRFRLAEKPLKEESFVERSLPDFTAEEEKGEQGFAAILFFVLQILLTGSLILIILAFVFFLIQQEYSKLVNIPEFFRNFLKYICTLVKGLFSRAKGFNFTLNTFREIFTGEGKVKKSPRREINNIKNVKLPADLKSLIITIYHSMLKLLEIKGERKKKTETPYEYSQMMGKKFKNISSEIVGITEIYVELVYSNHRIQDRVKKEIKTFWKKMYNRI